MLCEYTKVKCFPYTNNEQVEVKIKNTVSFTLAPPKTKYLDINRTKYIHGLYKKNNKIPMNKIKEQLNK